MSIQVSDSNLAKPLNISHKRGDTFFREKFFYTDETKSTILDITTDTFKMNVIKGGEESKSNPILSFTMSSGIQIISPNILRLSKSAIEMQIRAGKYTYDLQRTLQDGTVVTIEEGDFIINDDRTI